jgi:hypothetical protein
MQSVPFIFSQNNSTQKFIDANKLRQRWNDLVPHISSQSKNTTAKTLKQEPSSEIYQRKLASPYYNEYIMFKLVAGGYTKEVIENLTQRGLPVLDILYGNGSEAMDRSILTANLIVIGKIDSNYNDESFADGLRSSTSVSILETLKGDSSIKQLTLRNEGFVYNGNIATFSSHSLDFLPKEMHYYLLFLSKIEYETLLSNPVLVTINGHKPRLEYSESLKKMRQNCFVGAITSIDLGKNMEYRNNEQIKNRVEKVYGQCKTFGPFFPKSPLLEK